MNTYNIILVINISLTTILYSTDNYTKSSLVCTKQILQMTRNHSILCFPFKRR